MMMIIIIRRV